MESVVLVDEFDREIGIEEKLQAHLSGKLHRAISIFIFNSKGQMLLQQRAFSKYHSGGLWTNACCSHPRPNESPLDAAHRRLLEEMGFQCPLNKIFDFIYKADLDHQMIEHEFDHVFIGQFDGEPHLNSEEAHAWKWIDPSALQSDIKLHPDHYTAWFKMILERVLKSVSREYL